MAMRVMLWLPESMRSNLIDSRAIIVSVNRKIKSNDFDPDTSAEVIRHCEDIRRLATKLSMAIPLQ